MRTKMIEVPEMGEQVVKPECRYFKKSGRAQMQGRAGQEKF